MAKTPHLGDLVENASGFLGIVVSEQPCGDPECRGQIRMRPVDVPPGSEPMCYVRRDLAVVAPAAYLVAQ